MYLLFSNVAFATECWKFGCVGACVPIDIFKRPFGSAESCLKMYSGSRFHVKHERFALTLAAALCRS